MNALPSIGRVVHSGFANGTTVATSVLRNGSANARTDGLYTWSWPERN